MLMFYVDKIREIIELFFVFPEGNCCAAIQSRKACTYIKVQIQIIHNAENINRLAVHCKTE